MSSDFLKEKQKQQNLTQKMAPAIKRKASLLGLQCDEAAPVEFSCLKNIPLSMYNTIRKGRYVLIFSFIFIFCKEQRV